MKTNYLLIDYENVQPRTLALLNGVSPLKVRIFLGEQQSKVPLEFAKELQQLGPDAEYVQISGSGANAVDFHIAFTIGELSQVDPEGRFYVISKDTGYDPLIPFARKKGIHVHRSCDIEDLPMLKQASAKARSDKIAVIVENLTPRGESRPKKVKTLSSTINSLFEKRLSNTDLVKLIASLEKEGHISVDGESVSYPAQPTT
ncbi:PIN domain-containing protein [Blastopirellula sp. JC732]|uniref:PIN domain-containing protein n=1 Tax=Blastopirellula sediminis TaxID=2894196 RepID=A0A9X1MSB2_9BACT|nr:PIN domain-containing protein [Blastopirellula sediminis]MCC9605125.1 PIN domain-containing protein [Blastopirellula sediminis]MCC9631575.1 PIN domain-containing protein [Blastopirellula sediminis]